MKRYAYLVIGIVTLATTACLQKDTTSTIYLRADGAAEWVVFERDVRSDSKEPVTRDEEEAAYLDPIRRGQHPVAMSFAALGAAEVRTEILRIDRPYSTMVSGRFPSLTAAVSPILDACQVPYGADIRMLDGETTWTLWVNVGPDGAPDTPEHCADPFEGLADALDFTIVLERGSFTNAVGFTLEGPARARIDDKAAAPETLAATGGRVVYSLTWTER
jgi:hypothetical protein